jgi:hypothetical protein
VQIFKFIESQSAIDIKEYPVKDSKGNKMRIIFTIEDQEQAMSCYHKLANKNDPAI